MRSRKEGESVSGPSTDEASLSVSKGSSQEELDNNHTGLPESEELVILYIGVILFLFLYLQRFGNL